MARKNVLVGFVLIIAGLFALFYVGGNIAGGNYKFQTSPFTGNPFATTIDNPASSTYSAAATTSAAATSKEKLYVITRQTEIKSRPLVNYILTFSEKPTQEVGAALGTNTELTELPSVETTNIAAKSAVSASVLSTLNYCTILSLGDVLDTKLRLELLEGGVVIGSKPICGLKDFKYFEERSKVVSWIWVVPPGTYQERLTLKWHSLNRDWTLKGTTLNFKVP